jgi:ferric-dicitrate binding protein FerR (iron transport regulator)
LLDQWVKRSDENNRYFLRLRNSWLATSQITTPDRARVLKALDTVSRRISSPGGEPAGSGIKLLPSGEISALKYLRAAALWILLFGLGAVFAMIFLKPARMLNLNSMVSVSAPRGSKAITALPDGTVVWLNAGSRIEYKIPDNKPVREVSLEGEAFFKVARDPDHPFTVNAGDMIVKAYGTVFNVKAYPEEKAVTATLVEGSVGVEIRNRPSNRTLLRPDEQAVYYKPTTGRSENFLVTKGIDPALYTMWINDRLQIRGETLGDLTVMLERKYDVTIHFRDVSLKDMRFTGIIENETIEQVMELLKISSKIDYSLEGREIWLSRAKNK